MKRKKNLERAIILGLILSTGAYGTAWAEITSEFPEEGSVIITADQTVTPDTKIEYLDGEEKELKDFENITVYFNPQGNEDRALGVYSADYQLDESNVKVYVGDENNPGQFTNADGLHLSNHYPKFYVRSYEAYIYGSSSDAINLSHNITTDSSVFIGNINEKMGVNGNGNLTAVVYDGNGIRSNSSVNGDCINSITVGGTTDITLNGSTVTKTQTLSEDELNNILGDKTISFLGQSIKVRDQIKSMSATASYDPAAIYAGNDMYNFDCELKTLVNESGVLDGNLAPLKGLVDNLLGQVEPLEMGSESKGRGIVNLNKTNLTLNGDSNYGLLAGKNGEINVNGDLSINAFGKNSYGIAVKNANLIYGDSITATAELKGLVSSVLGSDPISADLNLNLDQSENKYGSKVVLNGHNVVIAMQGENSKAIYASGVDDTADRNQNSVTGENLNYLSVEGGDIVAEDGGLVDLHVTGNNQSIVNIINGNILAQGVGSEISTYNTNAQDTKYSTVNLTVDGMLAGYGTLAAANGGTVNVVLGDGSSWAGRADDYQDANNANWDHTKIDNAFGEDTTIGSSGKVKLTLGAEAIWDVTGQSWITSLTGNDSYIILDGDGTGGHALHIGEVNGNNTFVMNVRPTETGDMLYVKNGTNATQNLVINNAQEVLENMDVDDAVRFATVANAGGGFNGFGDMPDTGAIHTFGNTTRIADAGMFNVDFDIVYNAYNEKMDGDLADKDGTSSLEDINDVYNGGKFSEEKPGSDYVDEVYGGKTDGAATNSLVKADVEDITGAANAYIVRTGVTKENLSDAGQTIVNMSRANYKNAIYMDRLNKRLGEARYINSEEDQGMWVRLRHDRIGHSGEFRSMNTMYELGYDVKQDCDNGEHRLGFAVDYMRGSTSYSDIIGKGETKRYGLWLYDTWLGDKGHYADYVLKWGHLSNDFDIFAKTSGENITGDYSNNVFSASAEYGRKKDIGNDWYFEPQAQLQLARVTGADYVSSQDTKVSVDGINSLIGRAGFRLGKDLGERSTVYVKADLLHEFLGDQTITASDATGTFRETYENKGTWYDVGFGFATAMGKNSYAFMDFEKSFGNDNDETYQINAGVQWTF